MCKKIHRGGNAEQYHADKKYKEAVAEAVEACAEDTKGQKCYICLEAVHSRTGEGLVRGCACGDRDGVASGMTGVAHVSCLVEQANVLCAEAEDNNLRGDAWSSRWARWYKCGLCGQQYHGVVRCALGWACWKAGLKTERENVMLFAMGSLARGLMAADHFQEAANVYEEELAIMRRCGMGDEDTLISEGNLAACYAFLKQKQKARDLRRDIYFRSMRRLEADPCQALGAALNFAISLMAILEVATARRILQKAGRDALRLLGTDHEVTLKVRANYATAIQHDDATTQEDLLEAMDMMMELRKTSRRLLGEDHPTTELIKKNGIQLYLRCKAEFERSGAEESKEVGET